MHQSRPWRLTLAGALAVGTVFSLSVAAIADNDNHARGAGARQQARNSVLRSQTGTPDGDLADQQAEYASERTAPSATVSGAALSSAVQQAGTLPVTGSAWQEATNQPYNAQPADYTDPFWSNIGAGWALVGGRTTALAQT